MKIEIFLLALLMICESQCSISFNIFDLIQNKNISKEDVSQLAYYYGTDDLAVRNNWMLKLPNETNVMRINVPGTHDSGALLGGNVFKTQVLTLKQQLNAGIRYFDIRCQQVKNAFQIYHGPVNQNMNFNDVLIVLTDFLKANPTEMLYMRLKKENPDENSNRSFSKTFIESYYSDERYKEFFFSTKNCSASPTLAETRGKIFLIQNFNIEGKECLGRTFDSLSIQDAYEFETNWDLYSKWMKIKAKLIESSTDTNSLAVLNHLSGSTGKSIPIFPFFLDIGNIKPGTYYAMMLN